MKQVILDLVSIMHMLLELQWSSALGLVLYCLQKTRLTIKNFSIDAVRSFFWDKASYLFESDDEKFNKGKT